MLDTRTVVVTQISGAPGREQYKAATPNCPELEAQAPTEAEAVNKLIGLLRIYIASFGDKPVRWVANPAIPNSKDTIVRRLGGLWPDRIQPPEESTPRVTTEKEKGHG